MIKYLELLNLKQIINEAGSEKWYKSFNTEMQLKIMIYAHLAGTSSLRELENGFKLFSRGTQPPRLQGRSKPLDNSLCQ
ncbi:MAG: DUF4372 domain-containing protein [Deltaproteobacteria bacterium]|nr:DUF4372 domain-containing protein [Deltaproteobacteria bacterium]